MKKYMRSLLIIFIFVTGVSEIEATFNRAFFVTPQSLADNPSLKFNESSVAFGTTILEPSMNLFTVSTIYGASTYGKFRFGGGLSASPFEESYRYIAPSLFAGVTMKEVTLGLGLEGEMNEMKATSLFSSDSVELSFGSLDQIISIGIVDKKWRAYFLISGFHPLYFGDVNRSSSEKIPFVASTAFDGELSEKLWVAIEGVAELRKNAESDYLFKTHVRYDFFDKVLGVIGASMYNGFKGVDLSLGAETILSEKIRLNYQYTLPVFTGAFAGRHAVSVTWLLRYKPEIERFDPSKYTEDSF